MLTRIKAFFEIELVSTETEALLEHRRRVISAALLIEVATIDHHFDNEEMNKLKAVLHEQFELSLDEVNELIALAHEEAKTSTSLYQFTRLVNSHFERDEKLQLLLGMWKIAYADGHLDKYEEHIIRRVSELIYIPHRDFIKTKHIARND